MIMKTTFWRLYLYMPKNAHHNPSRESRYLFSLMS
jgi:hypothetical protein